MRKSVGIIETVCSILGLILLQQERGCTIYVTLALGSTIFIGPLRSAFGIKMNLNLLNRLPKV